MEPKMIGRYMCIETHHDFSEGMVYTIISSQPYDWGNKHFHHKHEGKPVDISKFHLIHWSVLPEE